MSHGCPSTYQDGGITFAEEFPTAPHTWLVLKAVDLLRLDGHTHHANIASRYLLPMLEGVTFCDVWGDPDYDGTQLLHYYCPSRPDQNYGYGSAHPVFKNSTMQYQAHPFYGYGNAAEYAQNRYDAAVRAYRGSWGTGPRDHMAGWVVDEIDGQQDPIGGKWANGASAINALKRFGHRQTPRSALMDLWQNHSSSQLIFPDRTPGFTSQIYVPRPEVFDHAPEWLDDHFNDADDIECYVGYDGVDSVVYAAWTNDTDSPMILYLPANSREHAFFLLGWAMHLVQDCTLPVHTTDSSWEYWQMHKDIETEARNILGRTLSSSGLVWHGTPVRDLLPALSLEQFKSLFPWPPAKGKCAAGDLLTDFRHRWYEEPSVHDYVRNAALVSQRYMNFVRAINTEDDLQWDVIGGMMALSFDTAIKAGAGFISRMLDECGEPRTEPITPALSVLLLED
jgi:hypothetical protein